MNWIIGFMAALLLTAASASALSDYQRGLQEGFSRGYQMAEAYNNYTQRGELEYYQQIVKAYQQWLNDKFADSPQTIKAMWVEVPNALLDPRASKRGDGAAKVTINPGVYQMGGRVYLPSGESYPADWYYGQLPTDSAARKLAAQGQNTGGGLSGV
ncbi:MAG: hypothetical protein A4E45_01969 [Methanosaeta sp. PtaB.Bin039]|nr:MAG: hypothetical protein A4E45_01969 [Methanosaeta sp. PtaB.Bin039]OPY45951.1 MAG: hypothetical protein A4E47_00788 [Methanosaeta sp. PtaU1.Bin028]HOT06495.1 hypothetical protein [Methanotrichaceae archaeon]HQF15632.1 hypothetical protein [Methanotrichaceae archaeon]HQI90368.1 hypothetical protein [Methanotrichaceae archaeon]